MQSIKLMWTSWAAVTGLLLILAAAMLAFLAWQRSGFSRSTGLLEGLRLTIVVLIALALNQPELIERFRSEQKPTLVVLADASGSMETRDVFDTERPSLPAMTRSDWLKPHLNVNKWQDVSSDLAVVMEGFSSSSADKLAGTDLHAALEGVRAAHDNLRAVVLFSDGDWNEGEPPARAAGRLRMKDIPVFAVAVGSETRLPDVELVRVDAPTFGVVNKPIRIPFVVASALPRDHVVTVSLSSDNGDEITRQVTIPAMSQAQDVLSWTPTQTGDVQLTVSVPVHEDEVNAENNRRRVPIAIRTETLKVLLVESLPRWEYRYLRNALERDPGVDVSCLLFHPGLSKIGGGKGYLKSFPATLEELAEFDVVFLGDVGVGEGQLTGEQCRLIKGLVKSQASGLILMPGLRGGHLSLVSSELEELYPVVLDAAQRRGWGSRVPAQFQLTETGRRSLLTKLEDDDADNALVWESLPGFQWYAPVIRAKAGAEVLAIHKSESSEFGRIPLLVTKTFGTGKVLFMGTDGAWRWREGVEDKYHYRFWGQVARWMAYQRSMAQGSSMRLFYAPDRPRQGDLVTLHANVMNSSGEPLQRGMVNVQVVSPGGKIDRVRLAASDDEWGLFTGSFSPVEDGTHRMTVRCQENGGTLDTTFMVQGVNREKTGQPLRRDVLAEIAAMTGGKLVHTNEIGALLDEIAALPELEPTIRRLRLWCHPVWTGLVVVLLGLFWTGRKMVGAV